MPTPFEPNQKVACAPGHEDWAARTGRPPASVFGNFRAPTEPLAVPLHEGSEERDFSPERSAADGAKAGPDISDSGHPLQAAIDAALARSFVYRTLAQGFEDPTEAGWKVLGAQEYQKALSAAVQVLAAPASDLAECARRFQAELRDEGFEPLLTAYLAVFGHAARGRCPLNEIEYGDIKADPLFQPHRLADLAAFYRAFGLEVGDSADERQDHICIELEFMCVLAAKEAYALEYQLDLENLETCQHAQKKFLRDHLGRWTPAFARRLAQMAGDGPLGALARLTRAFVEGECQRLGLAPGSEELLLRPVNEAAESLCNSCGLSQLPPGAQAPEPMA